MFLVDTQIKEYLKTGKIVVNPVLDMKSQLGSCYLHLRLGKEFFFMSSALREPLIDLAKIESSKQLYISRQVKFGEKVVIHPGETVMSSSLEVIKLPLDIIAFVQGRSSLARVGLLVNPGINRIDPGYKGKISIVLHNLGRLPITLYPGMIVISLSFAKLDRKVKSLFRRYAVDTYDQDLVPYKYEVETILDLETKGQQALLEEKIESLKDTEKQILVILYKAELAGERIATSRDIAKRINKHHHYISSKISQLVENEALFALRRPGRGRAFTYKLTPMGRLLAQTILRQDERS